MFQIQIRSCTFIALGLILASSASAGLLEVDILAAVPSPTLVVDNSVHDIDPAINEIVVDPVYLLGKYRDLDEGSYVKVSSNQGAPGAVSYVTVHLNLVSKPVNFGGFNITAFQTDFTTGAEAPNNTVSDTTHASWDHTFLGNGLTSSGGVNFANVAGKGAANEWAEKGGISNADPGSFDWFKSWQTSLPSVYSISNVSFFDMNNNAVMAIDSTTAVAAPEPASMTLLGLAGLAVIRRRKLSGEGGN